jgi:hypothetical protein
VREYLQSTAGFDPQRMDLLAVDCTHKLHPLAYRTDIVCQEWLVEACLAHHHYASTVSLSEVSFEEAFREYIEFLYLCWKEPTLRVLPAWREQFMWHCHLLDNRAYKQDMENILGSVLPWEPLEATETAKEEEWRKSAEVRKMHLPAFRQAKLRNARGGR